MIRCVLPGLWIPDSNFFPSRIQIADPEVKKHLIPDPAFCSLVFGSGELIRQGLGNEDFGGALDFLTHTPCLISLHNITQHIPSA